MKLLTVISCFIFQITAVTAATPTEFRNWEATTGHKIKASAVQVADGKVHLKKDNGKIIQVALDKFIDEDQEALKAHFKLSEQAPTEGSGAEAASGLPHPLGEMSGPVEAEGSTYHVYLPKSLKKNRKAPLLFYTHAGGGNTKLLKELTPYAEQFGWVLAISVESSNKAGWEKNTKNCTNCLDHILDTLPVDIDRIHYTGNSGGGAQSLMNTQIKKAFGVMPNIGYIPGGVNVRAKAVYGLGGGYDYNRYLTAHAADKYKKDGFHRMSSKGHSGAPADHRGDGMFWMHCKFLGKAKSDHADEAKDFELSTLSWLTTLKGKNPQRAYSNAVFFKELYEPSGTNAQALESLMKELRQDPNNSLYHEGLLAIDAHSGKHFAALGKNGGSAFSHVSASSTRAATKLQETYGHIPAINQVLEAMKKKTVGR